MNVPPHNWKHTFDLIISLAPNGRLREVWCCATCGKQTTALPGRSPRPGRCARALWNERHPEERQVQDCVGCTTACEAHRRPDPPTVTAREGQEG